MLELINPNDGVGTELMGLRAIDALLEAAGEKPDQKDFPDLNAEDVVCIGWTVRDLTKRLERRLEEIENEHNKPLKLKAEKSA